MQVIPYILHINVSTPHVKLAKKLTSKVPISVIIGSSVFTCSLKMKIYSVKDLVYEAPKRTKLLHWKYIHGMFKYIHVKCKIHAK